MDMDDVIEMVKSFLLNLVASFAFCLVGFFLLKWFASWYEEELSQTATTLLLIVIPVGFRNARKSVRISKDRRR